MVQVVMVTYVTAHTDTHECMHVLGASEEQERTKKKKKKKCRKVIKKERTKTKYWQLTKSFKLKKKINTETMKKREKY